MSEHDPSLSESAVRDLAALARLAPSDAEVDRMRGDLSAVLRHAECLKRAPLDGIEPMTRPIDESNRLGDDVPAGTLPREAFESMAPAFEDGFLRVPKVLGDGEAGPGGHSGGGGA